MKIECTPVTLSEEELRERLERMGPFNLNRFLIGRRPIRKIELKYVEYLLLDYEVDCKKSGLLSGLRHERRDAEPHGIRLIGNGSTGSVSYMETFPKTEYRDVEQAQIQGKDFGPAEMARDARMLIAKVMRRLLGQRFPNAVLTRVKSIYRPFWAVYYGDVREKDGKSLCWPWAADGFTVR